MGTAAWRFSRCVWAILVLPAALAHAQGTGTVRGIVINDNGQPVVGASVSLVAIDPSIAGHETATDERGQFEQTDLAPGHYSITAGKDELGGQFYRLLVQSGGAVEVRFVLEPGRTAAPWLRTRHDGRAAAAAFNAGVGANRAGDFHTAIIRFQAALDLLPSCVDCHFNIGVSYARLNRFDDAEAAYRSALTIRPEYAAAHYGLADIFSRQGRTEEAAAARGEANRIAVSSLETARASARDGMRRGRAFLDSGNFEDAVSQLDEVLNVDATLSEAYYWLGQAHDGSGDPAAARRAFARYLLASPNGEHAGDARRRVAALER